MTKITPEQINFLQEEIRKADRYRITNLFIDTSIVKELTLLHVQLVERIKQIKTFQQHPINKAIIKELEFLLKTKEVNNG